MVVFQSYQTEKKFETIFKLKNHSLKNSLIATWQLQGNLSERSTAVLASHAYEGVMH